MKQRQNGVSLGDAFCFLIPVFQFIRFDLVGEMSVPDVLILAAVPIAFLRHPERLRQKPVPTILTLGLFWLVAQIITDVLRHSAPVDYLRGWSRIVLLLASFAVVWTVACRSLRRFVLYGTGLGIGAVLAFFVSPYADTLFAPWKFALGGPVTLLVALWVSLAGGKRYLAILLPLSALAVLHAFEDVRSLAAITFLTAVFSVFHMLTARQQRLNPAHLVCLGLTIACGLWAFTQVYVHYAEQGVFGEYARHKIAAQSSGAGGLLLGGRGEILASSQAILDSPVIGHGSWARDPMYAAILAEKQAELGYKDFQHGKPDDLIPSHSYIFGAWVESGFAGSVFWMFVFGFTILTLLRAGGSVPLLPLFAFAGFAQLWDILFSPLGATARFTCPFYLAAMVALRACQDLQSDFAEVP